MPFKLITSYSKSNIPPTYLQGKSKITIDKLDLGLTPSQVVLMLI